LDTEPLPEPEPPPEGDDVADSTTDKDGWPELEPDTVPEPVPEGLPDTEDTADAPPDWLGLWDCKGEAVKLGKELGDTDDWLLAKSLPDWTAVQVAPEAEAAVEALGVCVTEPEPVATAV